MAIDPAIKTRLNSIQNWSNSLHNDHHALKVVAERVGRLAGDEGAPISDLISIFCELRRQIIEGTDAICSLAPGQRWHDSRPHLPIMEELARLSADIIIATGPLGTTELKTAYVARPIDSPDRIWLLDLLSETGDPDIEEFIGELTIDDIRAAEATADARHTNSFGKIQGGDRESRVEPEHENGFEEWLTNSLRRTKQKYRSARNRRSQA